MRRHSSAGLTWKEAATRALVSGTMASVFSTIALGACGRLEGGTASGPNSAPGQWLWGERVAHRRHPPWGQMAVGYGIHHLMSVGWAAVHEKLLAPVIGQRPLARRLAAAAATSVLACIVDYRVAPRRLRPGFEKQLGRLSLFAVYTAFALGLAAGAREGSKSGAVRDGGHLPCSKWLR